MLTSKQDQVFEAVARNHPQFVEYLKAELEKHKDTLVKVVDGNQFRFIQGKAQELDGLIGHLEKHKKAP